MKNEKRLYDSGKWLTNRAAYGLWLYRCPPPAELQRAVVSGATVTVQAMKTVYDRDRHQMDVLQRCVPLELEIVGMIPARKSRRYAYAIAEVTKDAPRGLLKPEYQDDPGMTVMKTGTGLFLEYRLDDGSCQVTVLAHDYLKGDALSGSEDDSTEEPADGSNAG